MSPRILVVDDDGAMVKTLCDILRLRGWEPHGAFSGAEALSTMTDVRFPVVLTDIRMPGMDGVTVFKEIKARFPNVRVILMTAYSSHELIAEAEREGALRVLPKPVDLSTLMPLLQFGLRSARPVAIIDDDPAFLRTLAASLEARGFRVITAENPHDLADPIGQGMAAVLLHLRLKRTLARSEIEAIRGFDAGVPVVVYTGDPPSADEARSTLPGDWISAYLDKPLPFDRLSELLDSALTTRA